MQAGHDLTLVWSQEFVTGAGFVKAKDAATGWTHPSIAEGDGESMQQEEDAKDEEAQEDVEMKDDGEDENPFDGLLALDGMVENAEYNELDSELNPDEDDELEGEEA